MEIRCIAHPRPGPWVRAVIIIVIYLVISGLEPGAATPLTGGAMLGVLLASGSGSSLKAWAGREAGR
jgi:hypothetical protein